MNNCGDQINLPSSGIVICLKETFRNNINKFSGRISSEGIAESFVILIEKLKVYYLKENHLAVIENITTVYSSPMGKL